MLDASLEKTMLSLEPPYKDEHGKPIPKLLDIMPEGEHTYEPQKEPVDVLGENLRRIFLERGVDFFDNHPDITSTLASQDTSLKDDKATGEDMSSSEEEGSIQPMTTEELLHMRHEISQNLFIANGEITLARDLISVLLSSTSTQGTSLQGISTQASSQQDSVTHSLPPSTLSATIVTKPPPIPSVNAFDAQLTVGGKDESLRKAADLLKSAATSIERGRAESERYWVDALKIRRANWGLSPAPLPLGAPVGRGADKNCTDFLISYGLEESPIQFRRRAIGRLPTAMDTEDGLITFPYRQRSSLRISLGPTGRTAADDTRHNSLQVEDGSNLYGVLQAAQREVVEQEIFAQLIREAGNLPTASARVSEQLIVIEAAQNAELRFELIASYEGNNSGSTNQHNAGSAKCDFIYALLQVLLLRSHTHARSQRLSNTTIVRANRTTAPPPILQPVIDLLQYEVFCERVRAEIDKMASALSAAGVPARVRFDAIGSTGEQLVRMFSEESSDKIGGQVVLRIDGRHTVRFTLLSPSTLTAHLPQVTLTVTSIPQLSQLLSDEVGQCLLSMICDIGRDLCDSVNGTWFVDSLAGRSLGKWEGAILDFRISFGDSGQVVCSLARMLRGQHIASNNSCYEQGEGQPLFHWVRNEIESALVPPVPMVQK